MQCLTSPPTQYRLYGRRTVCCKPLVIVHVNQSINQSVDQSRNFNMHAPVVELFGCAEEELPPSLPGIQRVSSIKVLGVIISNNLSMAGHVSALLDTCARTLYGLRVLRAHGLHQDCLDEVFRCTVLAKLLYASPAWSGFCSAADNGKLDRFLNRCRQEAKLSLG